jgi:Xaa-Pro dipeptidase
MNPILYPRPPGPQEFGERIHRLKERMKGTKMGAAILTPSANLFYFTGLKRTQSERLFALLVPIKGPMGMVVPSFEAPQVKGLLSDIELLPWREHEDPYEQTFRFLEGKTGPWPRIALDPAMEFDTAWRLMESGIGRYTIESGASLISALRRHKDPLEQSILAEAANLTYKALEQTWDRIQEGQSEIEIAALLKESFSQVNPGGSGGGLVQIAASSALPHGEPGESGLKEGDVILFDCGMRLYGYCSDITRMAVYGRATEKVREILNIVLRAQEAGFKALAPSVPCEEVDRAARRVILESGYGSRFIHRLGHGIGLEGHERPYLARGETTPLLEGDTVTVEPGIYLPEAFGIRIEDVAAVTEEGMTVLGDRPPGLCEIG